MDEIYPPREPKVYQVKEELDKLRNNSQANFPTSKEDIRSLCDMKAADFYDMVEEIESLVIADYQVVDLTLAEEIPGLIETLPVAFAELSDEARNLHTVEKLTNLTYRKNMFETRSDNRRKFAAMMNRQPTTSIQDLEIYSEIVLTVRFHAPFRYTPDRRVHPPNFHQQFLVLGSQFLTELRDKIFCRCNFGPFKDISESPFDLPDEEQVDEKPLQDEELSDPGFFFIHDTFYNDHRLQNHDYSQVIIDWSKKHLLSANFKSQMMKETKFEDLSLRIGHPYVSHS